MLNSSGKAGEIAAAKFLKKSGYKILEKNFRKTYGEIDIIASKGENVAFVEVQTRKNDYFGTPAEFVTKEKQQKIIKCAYTYIQEKYLDAEFTFDVIEVYMENKKVKDINHIKNAFYI